MAKISLTASMRSNLLSLQKTNSLMDLTQERLSTGKKVNSAIDNPSSFYTARSLNNRAGDLDALLDSMGQGIQTIKAATTAIETATSFLEQAKAVATQVLDGSGQSAATGGNIGGSEDVGGAGEPENNLQDFIDEGYEVISAEASADDIKQMITNGATKLVLADDLVLDAPLEISENDIIINGNGKKISYSGGDNLLKFTGTGVEVSNIELDYTSTNGVIYGLTGAILASNGAEITLSDITIKASGDYVHGVVAVGGSQITLDSAKNISTNGELARKVYNYDVWEIYDGEMSTKDSLQYADSSLYVAMNATNDYYVANENNANFGKGTWYLPAIGELAELFATDISQIGASYIGAEGIDMEHFNHINDALGKLGADAEQVSGSLWSSTFLGEGNAFFVTGYGLYLDTSDGSRNKGDASYMSASVRAFNILENCFADGSSVSADGSNTAPKIGDIMYADMTYSSADDYNTYKSKTAVGIIVDISEDGSSAKLMSLKSLGDMAWGFVDAANYSPLDNWGVASTITIGGKNSASVFSLRRDVGGGETPADGYDISQYQKILNQYDDLIDDAKYKGVNLLKNETLKIKFNETGSSFLDVVGKDISAANIGLTTTEWATVEDISRSIDELTSAIGQLRAFSGELGNNYSIVMNRQDFTENLINILTEGSDKLTLADMNEESANMLALQTRQQLAINALSLASQTSQGVLKLF